MAIPESQALETTAYIVIRPERRGYDGAVQSILIDRVLKTLPRLGVRDLAIKVTLRLDKRMFMQPSYEAVVEVSDKRDLMVPTVELEEPDPPVDPEVDVIGGVSKQEMDEAAAGFDSSVHG